MTDWPWHNFTPEEMACKDGTPFPLTAESIHFMNCAQRLRTHLGFAMPCTSGYRTPSYNESIGGAPDSAHLTAEAGDYSLMGEQAYLLVRAAPHFGFTGIGVKQKGPYEKRFIHLDTMSGALRPRIWSY